MRRLLPLVSAVVVVDTMLYAALVPLLPHFEHRYGLTKGGVGALAAAYAIGTFAGGLPAGIVAARFGARRAVLGGLALMSVASVGFALAGSFETLFAARLVQGFGSSLTWAGALAWLTLSTPRERRGTLMGSAMGAAIVGALLGPVIGAVASLIGVRGTFAALAGLGVVLAAWALQIAPPPIESQPLRTVLVALRDPAFGAALWLMTIPALLFGALNVLVPLSLSRHGFGALALGAVWVSAAAVEASVNPWIGRVTDRRGFAFPVRIALVGSFVVSLALAASEWPPVVVPLVFAAGLTFGGFYAPSLTLLSNSAERVGMAQGITFGVMNSSWALGNAIGPAAGGALAQATRDAVPFVVGAVICVLTFVGLRRLADPGAAVLADRLPG
ncbi:MAG TPA: MFS transporter [Gaiellaceae bacterium]|nr:MFS transporter [Gaiellaceae bacterium]